MRAALRGRWARGGAVFGVLATMLLVGSTAAVADVIEGQPGFTTTSSTKHVTVVERTDLPDLPAITCGAPAVAPTMVDEVSTIDVTTDDTVAVGPATIFAGDEQQTEFHVVAGEVNTDTLTTTTTTLHQTWQGRASGEPCPTEGHQGFTSTTASKHVTVVERTDLPELPSTTCGAPASSVLVDETTTSAERTDAIITVGPATIFIGEDQAFEYHVVSGEVDTTTLVTYTTTRHQAYQGTTAGAPCAETVAAPVVAPQAVAASPVFTG
jgi:hypothetical protein